MAPYQYFMELGTDNMPENMMSETNMCAMNKKRVETGSNKKGLEKFMGVYLRMG